jgi:protoporphyrinogen oxidase
MAGNTHLTGDGSGISIDKTYDFSQCHKIWRGELGGLLEPENHLYQCIVIGGGMSGLVAAWKLNRLGVKDILVLEKDERMGGLCCSDTINGVTAARASAYPSYPFDENMAELYEDLKLITVDKKTKKITVNPEHVLRPPYDQVFMEGKWIADPFENDGIDQLPVSQKVKNDLSALEAELEKLYDWRDAKGNATFDCPVDYSSKDKKMRALDDMTLGEYAVSKGWSLEMVKIFDPLLKSAYGLGHDRISAWAALDILADELLAADPGELSIGFPGGNAFFAETLTAKLLQSQLKTNTIVTQIKQNNNEVLVGVIENGQAKGYKANTAIFAAPQFMTPYLIADLPKERMLAAQEFEYASYVVANLEVTRTPKGLAYSNQLVGDFIMSDFIVADWTTHADPLKAPANRNNVLTAYCPMTADDRSQMLSPSIEEWQAKILKDFDKTVPGVRETVTGFHLYRWGHAFSVPKKGWVFSKERRLSRQPLERIFFAHADVEGIPTIDHAMASGFRAAEEVKDYLL